MDVETPARPAVVAAAIFAQKRAADAAAAAMASPPGSEPSRKRPCRRDGPGRCEAPGFERGEEESESPAFRGVSRMNLMLGALHFDRLRRRGQRPPAPGALGAGGAELADSAPAAAVAGRRLGTSSDEARYQDRSMRPFESASLGAGAAAPARATAVAAPRVPR